MRLAVGQAFGRYEILSLLGHGGMGSVFHAKDQTLRRDVALKLLRNPGARGAARERLLREARAIAALHHPNAVVVFDVGDEGGQPYIAMELVAGSSLRAYVGDARIAIGTRLRWLLDVARALEAAHARGIVHRDVKPENVMIAPDGTVKVLDFGIARAVSSSYGDPALTLPGRPLGTPLYMAPEQVRGEAVDPRSDQFAWAIMAYELLSGALPWGAHGGGLRGVAEMAVKQPLPLEERVPELAAAVAAGIAKALSIAKTDRFDGMGPVVALLSNIAATSSATPPAALAPKTALAEASGTALVDAPSTLDVHLSDPSGSAAIIGSKYRIVQPIARGASSAVYEVEHVHTGERWALKIFDGILSPIEVARFQREARMASRIKLDAVVRVIDADVAPEVGGAPFIVMDLLHGEDLGQDARPRPKADVAGWFDVIARVMDRAHVLGIVHRDLKAANLFLARNETNPSAPPLLKVLDFGVAKLRDKSTWSEGVMGTPTHMAPEQANGEEVGPGADIWSLGMLAFGLLAGRDYFDDDDVHGVLTAVVSGEIEPPSRRGLSLGAAFDAWFLRSCARPPVDRFSSVGEQARALRVALGLTSDAEATTAARRAPRGWTTWIAIAAAAVLVPLALFVGRRSASPVAAHETSEAAVAAGSASSAAASPPSAKIVDAPASAAAPGGPSEVAPVVSAVAHEAASPPRPLVRATTVAPAAPHGATIDAAPPADPLEDPR